MGKQKKTRAQRNAIRKQGLKEIGQGYKQWLIDGSKKAAMGAVKGAFDGAIAGDGVADKFAKGAVSAAKAGIGGAIKDVAQGTWKASKGIFKAIFNDLDWYTNYPELLKGMAGANFSIDDSIQSSFNGTGSQRQSKALIVAHGVALTNGSSDKIRQMTMQKIFESTRRANSGNVNYNIPDINAYYIIIRNIVALGSELRRGYGLTNYYTSSNLAVPNLYLRAVRCDASDFIANSANIRNYLKQLAKRLEVYVPLKLPIIERTEWMFRALFKDSDDIKAQPHAFVCGEYLHYDYTNSTWTTKSLPIYTPLTYAQYQAAIEDEMISLAAVCPAGVIAGDMLKAFGAEHLYHFGDTEEDYKAPFGYSEEVLTQIQNMVVPHSGTFSVGTDAYGLTFLDVTCGNVPTNSSAAMGNVYVRDMNEPSINFYKNEISNTEIIGASRLIVSARDTISVSSTNYKLNYGTELPMGSAIYFIANGAVTYASMKTYESLNIVNISTFFDALRGWSCIDWMPRINCTMDYYNGSGSGLRTSLIDVWDYNNSGFLSILSMQAMHEIALASLYYVPLLSRVQNNLVEVKS